MPKPSFPIPKLLPTVKTVSGVTVKLSASVIQHVVRNARDHAAETARAIEDKSLVGGPPEYVKAAKEAVKIHREAKELFEAAKHHRDILAGAVGIMEGAPTYDAASLYHPVVALALDAKAAADSLAEIDPEASLADLRDVTEALTAALDQLTADCATAKCRLPSAETEVRRCVGAAYASCAESSAAFTLFKQHRLAEFLPVAWPSGMTPMGAAKLVEDTVKQRRFGASATKRRSKTEKALIAARAKDSALDRANDDAVAALMAAQAEGEV